MKKILIFLLLLSGIAKAQLPGSTLINSRYEWLGGKFRQLKLPAYADTASYPTWLPALAGDIMLDTSGADAGTIYARYGASAAWVKVTAGIAPSAIDNDNAGTGFNVLRPATQQIKRISLGVGLLGDSTTFANSNYFYVDTNLIYSYARSIAGTGGGGSGNTNSNVGSAYRFAIPNTNNIKTFSAGFGGLMDSATSNQLQYTVDTSTIQKKLAYGAPIFKNNNTLGLTGWSAILPNSVYGADASGVGVMRRAAIIDTALRHNGWSVVWDSVNAKHIYQYITGSGGGSSGIRPKWLLMQVGVSYNAIAAGTTTIVHDSLIGHGVELAIDGHAMQPNSTEADGYTYTPGTGTIELVTPVTASSKIRILRVSDNIDTLTAQAPPVSWQYMAFTSPTLFTNTSNVYTAGSGSGWGSYALGTTPFIGDMSIRTQHVSSAQEYIVGLRTTNVAGDFTGYYVGYAVTGGVLYRIESGGSGSLSYSMSANEYARIVRSGSTFLIQVSMDGNTWTTKHTSSNTGSGTYYVNLNMYAQSPLGKAYYMMYK